MNRRRALLLVAALAAVALASLGVLWLTTGSSPEVGSDSGGPLPAVVATGSQAALYFPAASGMLETEMRATPLDLDPAARPQWLAEQLVAGPESGGLRPALPTDTQVASVFAAPDGTVFVDFKISESVGMGSTEELLALYSIVNTVLLDDEAARRVVVLINGRQRETLAGHLDTSVPLSARPDLIREAG